MKYQTITTEHAHLIGQLVVNLSEGHTQTIQPGSATHKALVAACEVLAPLVWDTPTPTENGKEL